jgi:hypothetical protein
MTPAFTYEIYHLDHPPRTRTLKYPTLAEMAVALRELNAERTGYGFRRYRPRNPGAILDRMLDEAGYPFYQARYYRRRDGKTAGWWMGHFLDDAESGSSIWLGGRYCEAVEAIRAIKDLRRASEGRKGAK